MRKRRLNLSSQHEYDDNFEVEKLASHNKENRQILPRLKHQLSQPALPILHTHGLVSLQSYIQNLLIQTRKKAYEMHQLKVKEENKVKKVQTIKRAKEQMLEQQQKRKYKVLQKKLNQLKGQMQLQQRKLKLQSDYQQKMDKKQERIYDRLYDRYAKKPAVDCSINTDFVEIKKQKPHKKSKQHSKRQQSVIINKNIQQILGSNGKKQLKRKSKPSTRISNKGQKKTKNLKRKFRVAIFVVIFSLFFPKYAKMFAQRRKNYFLSEITLPNLNMELQNIYKMLDKLNLVKMIDKIDTKNKDQKNLSQIQFQQQDTKIVFKLQNVSEILLTLMKQIRQTIKKGLTNSLLKMLSQLLLNNSFALDHFYLQQELFRLRFHPQKTYLKLTLQQEMISLVNFIIVKIIAFEFLVNNVKEKQRSENIGYFFEREQIDKKYNATQSRQLLLTGAYLTEICNQINFKSEIDEQSCFHGNIEILDPFYQPMMELYYQNPMTFQTRQTQKTRNQLAEEKQFLKPYLQIKNLEAFRAITDGLKKNKAKQKQILDVIIDIRKQLYKKLRMGKKQIFQQLKNQIFDKKSERAVKPKDEDEGKQKPTYLRKFLVQRAKYTKDRPEMKSTSILASEVSQADKSQQKAQSVDQSASENSVSKDNVVEDTFPQPTNGSFKKNPRLSTINSQDYKSNQQKLRKKLINKNPLMKMSNKQFQSGSSVG